MPINAAADNSRNASAVSGRMYRRMFCVPLLEGQAAQQRDYCDRDLVRYQRMSFLHLVILQAAPDSRYAWTAAVNGGLAVIRRGRRLVSKEVLVPPNV